MTQERLKPELGKFYRSKDGQVWCCFRARSLREIYVQSYCVRLSDDSINYFLDDHSFDLGGEIEDELVEVVSEQEVQRLPWTRHILPQ